MAPISNYDIYSAFSVLDLIRQSPLDKKSLKKVPNQLRSLMFSDSDTTKNDWINQSSDPLRAPETSQMMRMNYDTFGKLEAFVGFEKDGKGNNIVLKPKFKMLTKKMIQNSEAGVLLCKIDHYKNNLLGIGMNSGINMQIFDNYFLMAKSDLLMLANKMKKMNREAEKMAAKEKRLRDRLATAVTKGSSQEEIAKISSTMIEIEKEKLDSPVPPYSNIAETPPPPKKKKKSSTKKEEAITQPVKPLEEIVETLDDTIGPPVSEEIMELLEDEAIDLQVDYASSGQTKQSNDSSTFLGVDTEPAIEDKDDALFDDAQASSASLPASTTSNSVTNMYNNAGQGNVPSNTPSFPGGRK